MNPKDALPGTRPAMPRDAFWARCGCLGLAGVTVLFAFAQAESCRAAVADAWTLCCRQLLPALYPFLITTALIVDCGAAPALGTPLRPAARLLGFPGDAAAGVLLLSLLGGFAPAAAAAAGLYRQGKMDAAQASRLLAVSVCSGPSFTILAVGQMLGSLRLGILLYLSQIFACFCCGLALRALSCAKAARRRAPENARGRKRVPAQPGGEESARMPAGPHAGEGTQPMKTGAPAPAGPSLYRAVTDSAFVFVKLCGCVLYFRFLAGGLCGFFPALGLWGTILCEVSSGCAAAAGAGRGAVYLCCAALSLQSGSVLLQVRAIVPGEISLKPLLGIRVLHLPLSLLALRGLLQMLPVQAVYSSLDVRVVAMPRCRPDVALLLWIACCCLAVRLSRTLQHPKSDL